MNVLVCHTIADVFGEERGSKFSVGGHRGGDIGRNNMFAVINTDAGCI